MSRGGHPLICNLFHDACGVTYHYPLVIRQTPMKTLPTFAGGNNNDIWLAGSNLVCFLITK